MKYKLAVIAVVAMVFMNSCSSNSIIGKWKLTRVYMPSEGAWKHFDPAIMIATEMEFFNDGKLVYTMNGNVLPSVPFTADATVIPHRLVSTPQKERRDYSVYKIEGNRLTIKSNRNDTFPTDTGIEPEGKTYDLMEFERQH